MQKYTPKLNTLRLIWMSMLSSLVIYGVVLHLIEMTPQQDGELIATLMGAIAFGMVPVVMVLRKMTMGAIALGTPDVPPGRMTVEPSETEAAISKAMAKYQTGSIVGFAASEAIGVYGFVAAFMTADPKFALPFLAGSALMILIQYPKATGVLAVVPADIRAHAERRLAL